MKRRLSLLALACVTAMAIAPAAFANDYPAKPIRLVIPYPPGGTSDVLGRLLGQQLTDKLGQTVVVENKPGAAEAVGATYTAKAPADGYTLMLATLSSLSVNPSLYGSTLAYNPEKDFTPIVNIATVPAVMLVNPSVPVNTMTELTAYLKANPNRNYASPGLGTPGHLGMELYKKAAGVSIVHVPYRGGAPALQDLMGGQVDMMMTLVAEAIPLTKAGRVKPLAVSTLQRSGHYPDLPTISESGMKGFEIFLWYTLVAPTGAPADIVDKLNKSVNSILNDQGVRARLAELGIEPAGGTPEAATQLMVSESAKWKKVIEEAGIRPE